MKKNLIILTISGLFLNQVYGDDVIVLDTITVEGTLNSSGYSIDKTTTSTGLPLTIKNLPQSISVITSEQMADQNIATMDMAVNQTTGVSQQIYGSNRAGYNFIFARGNRVENIQLDGVPTNDVLSDLGNLSKTAYDRVEVVRGVSGLLDGSGEPSATVNLVRKRPMAENSASISVNGGSRNTLGMQADVSQILTDDGKVRARLVVGGEKGDTWRRRETMQSASLYGVIEAGLSDNTLLTTGISYDYGREDASASHSTVTYDSKGYATTLGRDFNPAPDWAFAQTNTLNAFIELEQFFNENWSGKFAYNFSQHRLDHPYGVAGILSINHENNSTDMIPGFWRGKPKTHSASATINGQYTLLGREHDVVIGVNLIDYKSDRHGARTIDTIKNIYNDTEIANYTQPSADRLRSINTNSEKKQVGGYIATQLQATDSLAFILGGRYSKVNNKSFNRSTQTMAGFTASEFTPYAGITYDINDTLTAYTSYSQLFIPQSQKDINGIFVAPATGDNIELGLKASFNDDKLNASLSAFHSRKDGLAVRAGQDSNGDIYYKNANHTTVKGIEFDIGGEITPNWLIQAGIAYAQNKDQDGHRVNPESAPKTTAKLFTTYDFKSGAKTGWKIGGGVRWQSETHVDNILGRFSDEALVRAKENAKQPAYAVVDLMAMYQLNENAGFRLNIDNVFDKTYRTQPDRHSYGKGRTVMATFKYDF